MWELMVSDLRQVSAVQRANPVSLSVWPGRRFALEQRHAISRTPIIKPLPVSDGAAVNSAT